MPTPAPGPRRSAVISNVFADDNRGGAAITLATVRAVETALPGCDLLLLPVQSSGSDDVGTTHRHTVRAAPRACFGRPVVRVGTGHLAGLRAVLVSLLLLALPRPALRGSARAVAKADVVVSKGGFVFVDRRRIQDLLAMWMTVFPLVLALRHRVPVVVMSASVGPFDRPGARRLSGWVLRRAAAVLPRDELSEGEVRSLGVSPARSERVPDSVFSFEGPTAQQEQDVLARLGLRARTYACVSVRGVRQHDEIVQRALADAIPVLLSTPGIERVLLVRQVDTDAAATRALAARLGHPAVQVVDEDLTPVELMALYGCARTGLATRLHHAIFGFVAGTPHVALSIDGTKTEGVFRDVGLERPLVVTLAEAAEGGMRDKLVAALAAEDENRCTIVRSVNELRTRTARLSGTIAEVTAGAR